MGTPIRLVRNDGGIIELMATTLTMNVDRGVSPHSLPFAGGKRYAFDLNLPTALITIEGVMTNDDLLNHNPTGGSARAVLDFSRTAIDQDLQWISGSRVTENVTLNNPGTTTHAIGLNTTGGVTRKVYLAKQNSTFQGLDSGSGRYFIAVHDGTSSRTASQIAASLVSLITTYTGIFSLSAKAIASPISGEADTAVQLTQTVSGSGGNRLHPSWDDYSQSVGNAVVYKPYHTIFSGGSDSYDVSGKSAGDKVAELFAVLNNSNNGGGGLALTDVLTLGFLSESKSVRNQRAVAKYGDYIIAIQIPFTSTVNNNESLFYMPTGSLRDSTDKTADRAKPAGTEFTEAERLYTGIKGSVANATFVQLGGEPIYSYTINFAPVDLIL